MDLRILHTTVYTYAEAAFDSFNELRLRPADDYRQTLRTFALDVLPATSLRSRHDGFGTQVHTFHLPQRHDRLEIRSRSSVVTYAVPDPLPVAAEVLPGLKERFFAYLAPSARVPLDRDWLATFGVLPVRPTDDLAAYGTDLTQYLNARFQYRTDATDVDTPLAEFARTGEGVCQDYAHAMLAVCRSAGIPARYVSGYVHPHPAGKEPMQGSEGSHAWVEVFLPGSGWVGFDPTNGCLITEAHVKIGVGRDYDDVPPIKGLRRGGGGGRMFVDVRVRLDTDPSSPLGPGTSRDETESPQAMPTPDDDTLSQ